MSEIAFNLLVYAAAVGGGFVLGLIVGHCAGYSDAIRAYGGWPKREAAPGAHRPVPRGVQVVKGLALVTLAGLLGACATGRNDFAELNCTRKLDSNEVKTLDGGEAYRVKAADVLVSSGPHHASDCTVKVRREGRDSKLTLVEIMTYLEAMR